MTPERRAPTILSVDDSHDEAALLSAALHESGSDCALRSVTSAAEAMAYLEGRGPYVDRRRHPMPALILLDIQMPEQDGFALLSWLRAQEAEWRRLPVVMLTTAHNYEEIRRAYDLGANSFLVKPAEFGELAAMLAQLVGYWLRYNEALGGPLR